METLKPHLDNYEASVTGQSVSLSGERRTRGRGVKDGKRDKKEEDLHEDLNQT